MGDVVLPTGLIGLLIVLGASVFVAADEFRELELGSYDILSAETTPVLWQGELLLVEGRDDKRGDLRIHIGGEPLINGTSHFRVRRQTLLGRGTNEVLVPMIPHSEAMSFCSAVVASAEVGHPETLWVFGTNDDSRWDGLPRSQVHAFWSSDPRLATWNHSVAVHLPPGYKAFNTDVSSGPDGFYMAIELNAPASIVGAAFTSVFAKTSAAAGAALEKGWELLDPSKYVYTTARYSACPTIRYFPTDGFFYLVTLYGSVPNKTSAVDNGYQCCFVEWVVRSKDLIRWESAPRNPIMGWPDWSDRKITRGSLLDTLGSARQKAIATKLQYSDINRSDMDMVELPPSFVAQLEGAHVGAGPWTYIVAGAGDQLGMDFGTATLVKASMHDWLASYFENASMTADYNNLVI